MKIRDYIILTVSSLVIGYMFASVNNTQSEVSVDSVDSIVVDSTFSVKGQTALFIGDSHTANHAKGWQKQLTDSVGFKQINTAVSGKTTYWMLNMAVYKMSNQIDYCFIYGGANDMYSSSITPDEAVTNIKSIAKMCNKLGTKCIVLTGFDPYKCTRTTNANYAPKYAKFQQLLLTEYMEGAIVIDTRVVDRRDCWDELCHMNPNGHTKIANKIISELKFKKVSK